MARLAASQDGVVGHGQLEALGFSDEWIKYRLRTGWLHVIFRGAYAVGHVKVSWRGRLRAATLSLGPLALISHRTAADLRGLRRSRSRTIHVTVPGGGHEDRDGIVLHRVRNIRPADIGEVDGIPVTSPARTCLDMAAIVRRDVVDDLLEAAERTGVLDLSAFVAVCGRGRRGSTALRRALATYLPIPEWTRSKLEGRLFRELRKAGAPLPAVNAWVEGLECDLVWWDEAVIVEIDGAVWHATTAARIRDPRRDTQLQLAGFVTSRVPENRLVHDIGGVVDDVVGVLRRRAARTPARPAR